VIVPKSSAHIGVSGERVVPLNGNHLQITKYRNTLDENYLAVQGKIRHTVMNITREEGRKRTEQKEQKEIS